MRFPPTAWFALLGSVSQSQRAHGSDEPIARELAGKPIACYPHFQTTRTFNRGDPLWVAFDPLTDAGLAKRTVDVYLPDPALVENRCAVVDLM